MLYKDIRKGYIFIRLMLYKDIRNGYIWLD